MTAVQTFGRSNTQGKRLNCLEEDGGLLFSSWKQSVCFCDSQQSVRIPWHACSSFTGDEWKLLLTRVAFWVVSCR